MQLTDADVREVLCWLDAPLTYPDFLEGVARVANALLAWQHDNLKVCLTRGPGCGHSIYLRRFGGRGTCGQYTASLAASQLQGGLVAVDSACSVFLEGEVNKVPLALAARQPQGGWSHTHGFVAFLINSKGTCTGFHGCTLHKLLATTHCSRCAGTTWTHQ